MYASHANKRSISLVTIRRNGIDGAFGAQISRYFGHHVILLFSQDLSALLICAFCRSLQRYFVKLRRIELTADVSELSAAIAALGWPSNQDLRLNAEKPLPNSVKRRGEMYEPQCAVSIGMRWPLNSASLQLQHALNSLVNFTELGLNLSAVRRRREGGRAV